MVTTAAPRNIRGGEVLIPNMAYHIAIQTRVPALAWGGTGVVKTQGNAALAKALGFKFYPLIGSCHAPEDFGGIPFPVFNEGHTELLPMKWVRKTRDPYWFIFMDEVTTIPIQVRPPALSMLSERRIGECVMHPTTIICGATNPPELAPNAAPLEKSLLNRFYHHKWEFPLAEWVKGMRQGQNFDEPKVTILPDNWETYIGKWSSLVGNFIMSRPEMAEEDHSKCDDDRLSFASPRAWSKAALLLAGAEACDAPVEVYVQLLSGMIGEANGSEFVAHLHATELYSPDEILNGDVTVDWQKSRFDVLACLPSAIVGAIKSENSDKRFSNAVKFFVELCEHEADLALYPLLELMPLMPDGHRLDQDAAVKFSGVVRQMEQGVN